MPICKQCNRSFVETKPWQEFCCQRHQQDWHLHQRKLARQERLFDRIKERENGMNGYVVWKPKRKEKKEEVEARQKARGEQRQKASEVLAQIIGGIGKQPEPRLKRRM
jgi:hypothetical protein